MNDLPVVGIDVSKDFSDYCVLSPDNSVFIRGRIYHRQVSMDQSLQKLLTVEQAFGSKPVCIMESTAYYHQSLYRFLRSHRFEVVLINPMQSKSAKNFNIRNVKTDKVDAYKLAMLYRMKILKPSIVPEANISQLRDLCRNHYELKKQLVVAEERLRYQVEIAFPGYARIFSRLCGSASLAVLARFSVPEEIIAADSEEITSVIDTASRKGRNWSAVKTEMIVAAANAESKTGRSDMSYSVIIKGLTTVVLSIRQAVEENDTAIEYLFETDSKLHEDRELLMTIPGIGSMIAAVLIGETGDFGCFKASKQLTAYYGLDPSVKQSGKTTSHNMRISKRGSPLARKMLRMAVQNSIHRTKGGKVNNHILAEYYAEKCRSKSAKTAECAVMRKLVGIIFAVMRDRKPFELRTPDEHLERMLRNCRERQPLTA